MNGVMDPAAEAPPKAKELRGDCGGVEMSPNLIKELPNRSGMRVFEGVLIIKPQMMQFMSFGAPKIMTNVFCSIWNWKIGSI